MVKVPSSVSWEAEEYIERSRNAWWFVGLVLVAAAFIALGVFLKMWTFIAVIALAALAILARALMPPRKIKYTLDKEGLTEGGQKHLFKDYKAFGILKDGDHYSAVMIPRKKVSLQVKVYFPEKNGEAIVDILGTHLPMEEVRLDFIDKLIKFLRIS
ncbi:MAG: hypothetical protein K6G36_00155 [Candidatus Saccharibacteria bacterium]|nr:hypothetical protein [Candidatus Saccharibacteria bacterium]